jgi:hypothetical protein
MKYTILYLCFGIFGCITLSSMAWVFSKAHHPPQLAVVDMQALIARQSRHLAKTSSAKVSARQIQETGNRLKEILEVFAAKHNIILLSKGALMGGGLPDHTDTILTFLEQEGSQQ